MASKRRIRKRECGDKIAHKTVDSAIGQATKYLATFGIYKRVYRCKWCGHFHIGSPSGGSYA